MTDPAPIKVFLSYSHQDEDLKDQIKTHLAPLIGERLITVWDDRHIPPGEEWNPAIEGELRSSGIILLLVSPGFLASGFIMKNEVPIAMERHEAGEATVIPVICRPCDWKGQAFSRIQGVPRNAEPISKWRSRDEACLDVAKAVRNAAVAPQKRESPSTRSTGLIARSRMLDLGVASRFDELIGRDDERQLLRDAWSDDSTRVLSFVAAGGVGKSSLVADWLADIAAADWDGVGAFYDWSFYSQGTKDQTAAHSGMFIDSALRHFGEVEMADSPATADTKAERLAERIAERRTLLILDGVEPLQHPQRPGLTEGRFKDGGVERLLKRLAQIPSARGLCVVTTRVPLVDLKRFEKSGQVLSHDLRFLAEEDAARLLHVAGARRAGAADIEPNDGLLLETARKLKGHALAIQLLGGYLKRAHNGDIQQRDQVNWERAAETEQEGHAEAVMEAYERWFEQNGEPGQRQLAAQRLLGFFDRPASRECLDVLRKGEPIPGLTEPLQDLSDAEWSSTLATLAEDHRLIAITRRHGRIEEVDSHPILREYFAKQLKSASTPPADENVSEGRGSRRAASGTPERAARQEPRPPDEYAPDSSPWTEGHRRLFEHLCKTTEHRPDTIDGLQPLYQAVAHGCHAGLDQKVLYDVYIDRIIRDTGPDGFYSSKKLGAISANLSAVANFFDRTWSRLSPNLSPSDQAWVLNEASYYLRTLGRLTEVPEPLQEATEFRVDQHDWKNASISTRNLSELLLMLGQISAAIAAAEQSVTFSDRSDDWGERMSQRALHADALLQASRELGTQCERSQLPKERSRLFVRLQHDQQSSDMPEANQARMVFAKAEAIQTEMQPECPRLISVPGFRYCDLLLTTAERESWRELVLEGRLSSVGDDGLKSHAATCSDVVERATRSLAIAERFNWLLEIGLDHLTMAKAALYQWLLAGPGPTTGCGDSGSLGACPFALTEHLTFAVHGLRESGQMDDIPRGLLTRAWQRVLVGDAAGGVEDLDEAWEIAERGPMLLYQADILLYRVRLFAIWQGQRGQAYPWDSAEDDLKTARELIDECGYHRRDVELEDAEAAFKELKKK